MEKSLAHTVWECKYHIVWVSKNRWKVIYDQLKEKAGVILKNIMRFICFNYNNLLTS